MSAYSEQAIKTAVNRGAKQRRQGTCSAVRHDLMHGGGELGVVLQGVLPDAKLGCQLGDGPPGDAVLAEARQAAVRLIPFVGRLNSQGGPALVQIASTAQICRAVLRPFDRALLGLLQAEELLPGQ